MSRKRCVLYARISVSKEESVSVDRQLESGRRLAELRGWEIVGEFVDDGVSATANRPEERQGWRDLLDAGSFDAVIIWKVDRLARRVLDFLHVDETLRKRGAGLVAVEDPIDMTTPMGRAFATILAVFGEMEAAAIASRVAASRGFLLSVGRFPGGSLPYGFTSAPNPGGAGRIRVQDPERIDWLRQIVAKALDGTSANGIATWLTDSGAPPPTHSKTPHTWSRQMVAGLLRSPTLAGMMPHNPGRKRSAKAADPFAVLRDDDGDPIIDESLAVISVADFDRLIRILETSSHPAAVRGPDRRHSSPLLSQVARCDECGVYLCRGTNQGKPTLYCPKCRQTIGRTVLDPWLIGRLLDERGEQPYGASIVRICWLGAERDDRERRRILLSQLDSLVIRRGVVGRRFDEDRVQLAWKPIAHQEAAA